MDKKEAKTEGQEIATPTQEEQKPKQEVVEEKPTQDIDKLLAEKDRIWQQKMDEALRAQSEQFTKELEDTVVETTTKSEEPKDVNDSVDINKNGVSEFAEKILEKRKKEQQAADEAKKQAENDKLMSELNTYRLEKKLASMFKEEPWLEEPILEAMKEGLVKSEQDIKLYMNDAVKNRLKMAWAYDEASKKAGVNPLSIYEDNNIVTDQVVQKQNEENAVKEWQKDLGIID